MPSKIRSFNLLCRTFPYELCGIWTNCVSVQTLEQKEEEGSSDEGEGEKKKPEEEEAEGEEECDEEEFEGVSDSFLLWY